MRKEYFHRTMHTKRTQGTMQATGETALPETHSAPLVEMKADGDVLKGTEANTERSVKGKLLEGLPGSRGRGMHGERHQEIGRASCRERVSRHV